MTAKSFQVTNVRNSVYMSKGGRVVQGYELTVYVPEFDEDFTIKVKDNNPATIDKAIKDFIARRKAINELG
jgi:hypothetical protein